MSLVVRYRNRLVVTSSIPLVFEGVIPYIERKYQETDSEWSKQRFADYLSGSPVHILSRGKRLSPEILAVTVGGLSISDVADMSLLEAHEFMNSLDPF